MNTKWSLNVNRSQGTGIVRRKISVGSRLIEQCLLGSKCLGVFANDCHIAMLRLHMCNVVVTRMLK